MLVDSGGNGGSGNGFEGGGVFGVNIPYSRSFSRAQLYEVAVHPLLTDVGEGEMIIGFADGEVVEHAVRKELFVLGAVEECRDFA